MIFQDEMRQNLLFDDSKFSNAKRYFWALQSLRVFEDHIAGTLRNLDKILGLAEHLDGSLPFPGEEQMQAKIFGEFKARIERKRQELEGLNNGVRISLSPAQ